MSEDKNLRKAGLKVTLPRVRILEILSFIVETLKHDCKFFLIQ